MARGLKPVLGDQKGLGARGHSFHHPPALQDGLEASDSVNVYFIFKLESLEPVQAEISHVAKERNGDGPSGTNSNNSIVNFIACQLQAFN